MKNFSLTLIALFSILAHTSQARAEESLSAIAANKAMKTAAITNLIDLREKHQTMSQEEIVVDLSKNANQNAILLVQKGVDIATLPASLEKLQNLDKDTILALETQHLQSLQTSTNYLFVLTAASALECYYNPAYIPILPIVLIFDLVILPIELLASLSTGF